MLTLLCELPLPLLTGFVLVCLHLGPPLLLCQTKTGHGTKASSPALESPRSL